MLAIKRNYFAIKSIFAIKETNQIFIFNPIRLKYLIDLFSKSLLTPFFKLSLFKASNHNGYPYRSSSLYARFSAPDFRPLVVNAVAENNKNIEIRRVAHFKIFV